MQETTLFSIDWLTWTVWGGSDLRNQVVTLLGYQGALDDLGP